MDLTLLEGRIGGSTVYAQSLVSELRRREDVDVSVISSGSAGGPLATARWMLAGANAGAHAAGADILHCPAFLAPLKSDVPLVITIHDLALGRMPEGHAFEWRMYYRLLVPRLARKARVIITPTETTKADVVAAFGIPPDRVRAIHSGIDERFFGFTSRDRAGLLAEPLIVFSGPPIARKNLDLVLRAMANARGETATRNARLHITGASGSEHPRYDAMIDDLGLRSRVTWTGALPFQDLAELYRRADLLVYPSFLEGFGFPPLEAMAVGTPVVASNASCLPEVLGDGALLVDPHDDAGFAQAVESVLTDGDVRRGLVARGVARARQFTWSRCAELTVAAYRRAAGVGPFSSAA